MRVVSLWCDYEYAWTIIVAVYRAQCVTRCVQHTQMHTRACIRIGGISAKFSTTFAWLICMSDRDTNASCKNSHQKRYQRLLKLIRNAIAPEWKVNFAMRTASCHRWNARARVCVSVWAYSHNNSFGLMLGAYGDAVKLADARARLYTGPQLASWRGFWLANG